jgi:hypothetical protein
MLAQIPGDNTLQILVNAGAVTILALALLALAYALLKTQQNKSRDEDAENKRVDKLIDRLVDVFSTVNNEQVNMRKVISENSETQRLVVTATNEQTGEVRLLRADFKNYQQLQTETVQNLRDEMLAFKGEIQDAISKMLEQITVTNDFVEQAVNEHQTIIDNGKVIIETGNTLVTKADHIIALLPPPPPAATNVVNVGKNEADDESDLPKAS